MHEAHANLSLCAFETALLFLQRSQAGLLLLEERENTLLLLRLVIVYATCNWDGLIYSPYVRVGGGFAFRRTLPFDFVVREDEVAVSH